MYYVVKKDLLLQFHKRGHIATAHYIDLSDGDILAKIVLSNNHATKTFESHPSTITLPHISTSRPVGDKVAAKLQSMGVNSAHTTYDVVEKAAEVHSGLRLK